ncbi:MAG: hypothetical protein ACRDRZ_17445 [Pseudonocardiaceae bacterium]
MSGETGDPDRLQILYLGSSADLGALRRSMEAHGTVTRTRLTPEVAAVVADDTVRSDHPTVKAAGTLGVPVLDRTEAIAQLAGWMARPLPAASPAGSPAPRRAAHVIAATIAVLVTVLAVLAVLGLLGLGADSDEPARPLPLHGVTTQSTLLPGDVTPY